jgi:hypothetical protein
MARCLRRSSRPSNNGTQRRSCRSRTRRASARSGNLVSMMPVDADARSWSWTVADRSVVGERGVLVVGEHSGALPIVGRRCVIRDPSGTVDAVVAGLERFHHREGGKFSHHSWGLLLARVGLDDVRIGAVVTPTEVEASST